MKIWVCPKGCGHEENQPLASAVSHPCPNNGGKSTPMNRVDRETADAQ